MRSAMGGTIAGKVVVTPLRDDARGAGALVVRGWAPAAWQPDRAAEPQRVGRVSAASGSAFNTNSLGQFKTCLDTTLRSIVEHNPLPEA